MWRRLWLIAAVLAGVIGAGVWLWSPWWLHGFGAAARNARIVEAGRGLYAQHCASCHGNRLQGQAGWREKLQAEQPPAPALDGNSFAWWAPDRALFGIVKHGLTVRGMPAFRDKITDADIWAIIAYVKSTWPAETRKRHDELDAAGPEQHGGE